MAKTKDAVEKLVKALAQSTHEENFQSSLKNLEKVKISLAQDLCIYFANRAEDIKKPAANVHISLAIRRKYVLFIFDFLKKITQAVGKKDGHVKQDVTRYTDLILDLLQAGDTEEETLNLLEKVLKLTPAPSPFVSNNSYTDRLIKFLLFVQGLPNPSYALLISSIKISQYLKKAFAGKISELDKKITSSPVQAGSFMQFVDKRYAGLLQQPTLSLTHLQLLID